MGPLQGCGRHGRYRLCLWGRQSFLWLACFRLDSIVTWLGNRGLHGQRSKSGTFPATDAEETEAMITRRLLAPHVTYSPFPSTALPVAHSNLLPAAPPAELAVKMCLCSQARCPHFIYYQVLPEISLFFLVCFHLTRKFPFGWSRVLPSRHTHVIGTSKAHSYLANEVAVTSLCLLHKLLPDSTPASHKKTLCCFAPHHCVFYWHVNFSVGCH